jgi:hypothetical protein
MLCAIARRTPFRDARAGRSRQWLGAVPAARVWAARRSLPPGVTLAACRHCGESRTAPDRVATGRCNRETGQWQQVRRTMAEHAGLEVEHQYALYWWIS